MIRLLTDENFNGKIVRGLRRRKPDIDLVRVQDTPLYQASDPKVLQWAAENGRVLLSHDADTLIGFAYERVAKGLPMRGVLIISDQLPVAKAIEELLIVAEASQAAEWENNVAFLPL